MRKTKEVLRLRYELGLGQRAIARSCSISHGAVHNYLKKATAAGIHWPLPEGLRAGELLGLRVDDINTEILTIKPSKQADDRSRNLRDLKTRHSKAPIVISKDTAKILDDFIGSKYYRKNPLGLVFANTNGRPMKRRDVTFYLKRILVEMGLPTKDVGLHAFRHGLATTLVDNKVSLKDVQRIMRHSDVKTTLRYVHTCTDSQRAAIEGIQSLQFHNRYNNPR